MKIAIVLGTRPEIIKFSPIINELLRKKLSFFILHTNQHYSKNLDDIFFKELRLPAPKYNLGVGSGTHAFQVGKMLPMIEKVFIKEIPDVVLVQGDTNTALAGALTAAKLGFKVAHVEAGLRSYFKDMPEEINRIIIDNCSDFLFAPTKVSQKILLKEGFLANKIFITGNTIVDALYNGLKLSNEKRNILNELGLQKDGYFLLTIHRQENVDDKKRLKSIFLGLSTLLKKHDLPLVYPIHPRGKKMINEFKLKMSGKFKLIDPVGYLDFLGLEDNARLIFTDSGGVQEEACILKVPCVTLRDNTERPESVSAGGNILAGVAPEKIMNSALKMLQKKRTWGNPFGDGLAAEKIIDILLKNNS